MDPECIVTLTAHRVFYHGCSGCDSEIEIGIGFRYLFEDIKEIVLARLELV